MKPPTPTHDQTESPDERLLDCIHCGICLSACPTFDLLGTEADSPRGRIYLIRALAEGRVELTENVVRHFDTCLGCRACETACPSGVPYAELLTPVRDEIEKRFPRSRSERRARRVLLDLLTHPSALAPLLAGARLATGLFGKNGPVAAVNRFLFGAEAPEVPLPAEAGPVVKPLPVLTPARGERRARVAFLAGCVMQVLFQRVNRATLRVLAANGCEVITPRSAGCCGAFHMHNGFLDEARKRARALLTALERESFDALVVNSAGCGSTLKEYGELFRDEPEWRDRAEALAGKSKDVSEFLAELGPVTPPGELRLRAAYHDACHLAHGQGVRAQPRRLLGMIPGLQVVEIAASDTCCGSAGIYNFLQPEIARRLQERKVESILAVEPDVVVMGNPGCHSWIEAGLRAHGCRVPVRHTVELLDAAYGGEEARA